MDKDVLVVIGVGGMGLAIARRLGGNKRVLLADFNETTLASAAELLRGEGHDVTTSAVDVSDRASVTALADRAAGLGRLVQVAQTAGLSPAQAPVEAIIGVDLLGVAYVLDEFARVIAPGGAGLVIASMAGAMAADGVPLEMAKALSLTPTDELASLPFVSADALGNPGAAYSIAKRANQLRVQAVAGTWGQRGARVNSISPGVVSTPMGQEELASESGASMRGMIAASGTGRVGTPDDIAAAAAFLLGPDSTFITGTDLLVDGGVVAAVRWSMPRA